MRFSTITAVKAGWLLKSTGTWTLTEEGRIALTQFADPEELMRESIRLYREWAKTRPKSQIGEQGEGPEVPRVGHIARRGRSGRLG